jgi:hypothetical protein
MRGSWALGVLVACGGKDPGGDTAAGDPCEGAGTGRVEVGEGGASGFSAWADGATVPVATVGGDEGLRVELQTTGLDTRAGLTTVIDWSVGGLSDTAVGSLLFQCDGAAGWAASFLAIEGASGLVGQSVSLTATVTDGQVESAVVERTLVLGAP